MAHRIALRDVRTRDDLIRDDYEVPDGSLEDGQYVIELHEGQVLLRAFRAERGPVDFGPREPVHENTSGARWKRLLFGRKGED